MYDRVTVAQLSRNSRGVLLHAVKTRAWKWKHKKVVWQGLLPDERAFTVVRSAVWCGKLLSDSELIETAGSRLEFFICNALDQAHHYNNHLPNHAKIRCVEPRDLSRRRVMQQVKKSRRLRLFLVLYCKRHSNPISFEYSDGRISTSCGCRPLVLKSFVSMTKTVSLLVWTICAHSCRWCASIHPGCLQSEVTFSWCLKIWKPLWWCTCVSELRLCWC